ncbi:MAG: hypothetical protein JOS17DRAFT_770509 [Linnemannia elongata]|nr:MAG: hypothetical protein JOS17DRAFT_770509 [Linnemannia elongata]
MSADTIDITTRIDCVRLEPETIAVWFDVRDYEDLRGHSVPFWLTFPVHTLDPSLPHLTLPKAQFAPQTNQAAKTIKRVHTKATKSNISRSPTPSKLSIDQGQQQHKNNGKKQYQSTKTRKKNTQLKSAKAQTQQRKTPTASLSHTPNSSASLVRSPKNFKPSRCHTIKPRLSSTPTMSKNSRSTAFGPPSQPVSPNHPNTGHDDNSNSATSQRVRKRDKVTAFFRSSSQGSKAKNIIVTSPKSSIKGTPAASTELSAHSLSTVRTPGSVDVDYAVITTAVKSSPSIDRPSSLPTKPCLDVFSPRGFLSRLVIRNCCSPRLGQGYETRSY